MMDRLRRSLRESFRRRKEHVPECSKPHQWQADEVAVRAGTCNFQVKYLGCVEVFESRGMQVCEEALKVLRNSRRRPIKGTLYVTGDGLRVVDDDTKGLIVDQTIEKVSFCAPDRNHEKGFSYICRDGTTRRWMCHGFLAFRDSGERLSHAVGCAFAVCLEKKQKRDKETVMMNFDTKTSTFTRTGSFRTTTLTEKLNDPQESKPGETPQLKNVVNPFAIERPHATPSMLQRQGSFRVFAALNQTSPFKRQLSLRVNDLPSTLERQRAMSLESADLFSRQNGPSVAPIPESSPVVERPDSLSAMCQQVAHGLSILSSEDPFDDEPNLISNPWSSGSVRGVDGSWITMSRSENSSPTCLTKSNSNPSDLSVNKPPPVPTATHKAVLSPPLPPLPPPQPLVPPRRSSPNFSHLRSQSVGSAESFVHHKSPLPSSGGSGGGQIQSVWTNGNSYYATADAAPYRDPFDAEWASITPAKPSSTNPFAQNTVKTFEVQM